MIRWSLSSLSSRTCFLSNESDHHDVHLVRWCHDDQMITLLTLITHLLSACPQPAPPPPQAPALPPRAPGPGVAVSPQQGGAQIQCEHQHQGDSAQSHRQNILLFLWSIWFSGRRSFGKKQQERKVCETLKKVSVVQKMSQWSKTNQVFMKSNFLSDLRKKEKVLYFSLRDIFVLESPDHIAILSPRLRAQS